MRLFRVENRGSARRPASMGSTAMKSRSTLPCWKARSRASSDRWWSPNPAYGPAQLPGDERDQEIFRVEFTANSVAAAVFQFDHADLAGRHIEQAREHGVIEMDHLGRPPNSQQALPFVIFGNQPTRFEGYA